ncbi:MAG: molecular chaperone DnaJ, partial [Myxococcaceae bacterium]
MEPAEPQSVFIRNASGQVWGPVALANVEELFETGQVAAPVEVSQDGVTYVEPGRMPEVRGAFPRETWGSVEAPAEKSPPATPPPATAPMAGPGAMAAAAARAARSTAPNRAAAPPGKPVAPAANPTAAAAKPLAPAATAAPPSSQTGEGAPAHVPVHVVEKDPPPASGELGQLSSIRLYYLAVSSDQSGLLSFKLPDRTIEVHFRKGNPEYVSSNHPDDSLQQFLRNQANVSAAQLETAQGCLEKFGGDLIAALFGLRILNPGTAFVQLAQRATGMLLKALIAERGSFTYELKELPAAKAMPLGNRWAVLSEQVRRIPVGEMKRRLHDSMDLPLMKSGGRVPASDLRLTPQETRGLALVDGLRSLNQLAKDLPAEADTFARLAFYLRELELLSFAALRASGPKVP